MRSIVVVVAAILALVCLVAAFKPYNPITRPSPYNPNSRNDIWSDRAAVIGEKRIQKLLNKADLFVERAKKTLNKFDKKGLKKKFSAKWKKVKKALKEKKEAKETATTPATLSEEPVVNSFVKCQACKFAVEYVKKHGSEILNKPEVRTKVCSRFQNKAALCELVILQIAQAIQEKADPTKVCTQLKFCDA